MSILVPSKWVVAIGVYALALGPWASAGCNGGDARSSGAQATGTDGSTGTTDAGSASTTESTSGMDTQGVASDTTVGGATTSDTTGDPGPEPYPEECYEPETLIEVTSAVTPSGPMTIDEAWLGADYCSGNPYVVLVQYPSPEATRVEVFLMVQPETPVDEPLFGVHPLTPAWDTTTMGTVDIVEPFEGGLGERHLHGLIELHEGGWDLSLEVDLLDCGVMECFCPCR